MLGCPPGDLFAAGCPAVDRLSTVERSKCRLRVAGRDVDPAHWRAKVHLFADNAGQDAPAHDLQDAPLAFRGFFCLIHVAPHSDTKTSSSKGSCSASTTPSELKERF